jgi:hypothetical protein
MRAISPKEIPPLPEGTMMWSRSTKRAGGMYHAHLFGYTSCTKVRLERHHSEEVKSLNDMRYWGVCPKCYAIATKKVAT